MKKLILILIALALTTLPVYAGPVDVVESVWSGLTDVIHSMLEVVYDAIDGAEEPASGEQPASFTEEPEPPVDEMLPDMEPNG